MVYIPSGQQATQEDIAKNTLAGVSGFLIPSPDCNDDLLSFICLNLFGVCTDSGEVVRPSSSQCEMLRTDVCASEWLRAQVLISILPPEEAVQFSFLQCETLANESICDREY